MAVDVDKVYSYNNLNMPQDYFYLTGSSVCVQSKTFASPKRNCPPCLYSYIPIKKFLL